MSVSVRQFKGIEGKWEVDIRFEWPNREKHRERVVAPGTTKPGALKDAIGLLNQQPLEAARLVERWEPVTSPSCP